MSSYPSELQDAKLLDPRTRSALQHFSQRRRLLLLIRAASVGVIVFVAGMLVVALLDHSFFISDHVRWTISLAAYAVTLAAIWYLGMRRIWYSDPERLAKQLETADPRVREDLLSAVELADPNRVNGSESFRSRLQNSVARRVATLDMAGLLPIRMIRGWISGGTAILVVCIVCLLLPSLQFGRRFGRAALPGIDIQRASKTKITIIRPSPADGFVASGDTVAVIANVGGQPADTVRLRWRGENGESGETLMSPRDSSSRDDSDPNDLELDDQREQLDRFAANLSFGETPIQYQIIAGDAITLWHELVPLRRPRTAEFEVRYRYPQYAKLDDGVHTETHGDLQAIVGTDAEVTVTFDQPVKDPVARYPGINVTRPLLPADDSQQKFVASIPIRTSGQYQIDATSLQSGLDNPFSPTYNISAIPDAPPAAKWTDKRSQSQVATPIDVLSLSASIQDDLPVDVVVQEYWVNSQPVQQRRIETPNPRRESRFILDWDMTHLSGDSSQSPVKIKPGDILRTKLVAVDRRGQRGESPVLTILIANDGFTQDRHKRLNELSSLVSQLIQWTGNGNQLLGRIEIIDEQTVERFDGDVSQSGEANSQQNPEIAALSDDLGQWLKEGEELMGSLRSQLQSGRNASESSSLELLGRGVLHAHREMRDIKHDLDSIDPVEERDAGSTLPRRFNGPLNQIHSAEKSLANIDLLSRNILGYAVTLGFSRDAMLLRNSVQPVIAADSTIPDRRLPRYVKVAGVRLSSMLDLLEKHSAWVPDTTRRHFQGRGWQGWAERWIDQFQNAAADPMRLQELRQLLRSFESELASHVHYSLVDGRLASTAAESSAAVRSHIKNAADLLRQAGLAGERAATAELRKNREKSPVDVERSQQQIDASHANFSHLIERLQRRLESESELHRSRPVQDLQHIADLGLLGRAVSNVSGNGYAAYEDVPPEEVYRSLTKASRVIEAVHDASILRRQLAGLLESERRLNDDADAKLAHAFWLDLYRVGMDWPLQQLDASRVSDAARIKLEDSRRNQDFLRARSRLDQRRWSGKPPISADDSLQRIHQLASEGLAELAPDVAEARRTIMRFVLSIADQAREAAKLAEEAKQRTDANRDADQPKSRELASQQREAERAATETVRRLHDRANTANLADASERELAQDADLAAASIASALRQAEESMKQANDAADPAERARELGKNVEALARLEAALEQTAEHFDRAENGQDLSESRGALQQSAEEVLEKERLDQERRRAESLARAAESDPEEMLDRLEAALKENEVMQDELSDIARQAIQSAVRKLQQAASEEQGLNESLERSDPSRQEMKRRMAALIQDVAARINALDGTAVSMAKSAAELGSIGSAEKAIDKLRQQLRSTTNTAARVRSEDELLSNMTDAARQMVSELADAAASAVRIPDPDNESIAQLQANRQSVAKQIKQMDQVARNARIQNLNERKQSWSNVKRQAGKRVQQAQQRERQAESSQRTLQKRQKSKPSDTRLAQELKNATERVQQSKRAVQAAKETVEFADQNYAMTDKRLRDLKTQKTMDLDPSNPARDAVAKTMDSVTSEIQRMRDEMEHWTEYDREPASMVVPEAEASRMADQQKRIQDDVSGAAEDVQRAGRHEERLEKEELATALKDIAQSIAADAMSAAENARQSLANASHDPKAPGAAAESMQTAMEQFRQGASRLQSLLSGDSSQQASTDGQTTSDAQSNPDTKQSLTDEQSRQLARTLDDLDRALADRENGSESNGDAQAGPQNSETAADSASSTSGQSSSGGDQQQSDRQAMSQSAADASPTLESMLQSARQSVANERRRQMQSDNPDDSSPSNQSGQNASDGIISLAGMEEDGAIDPTSIDRVGDEWGQLRERGAEDTIESQLPTVAPQYRRQVSAYFRAIAERAAKESSR